MKKISNIVNDNDEIIGVEDRELVHQKGLLHREIHVYFITPDKKIILQHRAPDKDMFPDLLDATVGGHVEVGQNYEETALKETKEETGIKLNPADLIFIEKVKTKNIDEPTGRVNYVFSSRYLYIYRGDIKDLKIEAGKAIGFESWPIAKLLTLSDADKKKIIPSILSFIITDLAEFIKNI